MNANQQLVAHLRRQLSGTWLHPPTLDSWVWLVTEVGEVGDMLMRSGYGASESYARNELLDEPEIRARLEHEIGDVMLMLCTLANHLGIDLTAALGKRVMYFAEKYGLSGTEG